MAFTEVDLSQASKDIATPTLTHQVILGNPAAAVGARAGVASLQALKDLIGGGGVTVSATAPSNPSEGHQWWDTTGTPDAALKVRIGSAWVSAADPRVATWARAVLPSGTAPVGRLGTGLTSTSVFLRGDGAWAAPPAGGTGGGLTTTQVDARVATWARHTLPTGEAPVLRGGTGSSTVAGARTNLGLGSAAEATLGVASGNVAALSTGGIFPRARLGSGASDTRWLRGDGTWQVGATILFSEYPTMEKFSRGSVATTDSATTLATLRAQCVEANRDTGYVPPNPITSLFAEPNLDNYILRQRFLVSVDVKWSNFTLTAVTTVDDSVAVFALLSDRFGRLGPELGKAVIAYSGGNTASADITLSEWGAADADGKWWAVLEVYCIEGGGVQEFDYGVGYIPDGGVAVAVATVNDGLVTVTRKNTGSLAVGAGLGVIGGKLTAPGAAAIWALESGPSGQAPVARLGTGVASSSKFLRGDGTWDVIPATTGTGLNATQVDARVVSWALANSPSGAAPITRGGTGGENASAARTNLGLGSAAQAFTGTAFGYVALLGTGGRFTADRLGSGVASSSVFLRGDGAWVTPPAPSTSGLTTTQVDARIVTWALANSPSGLAPLIRGGTGAGSASGARGNLGLGTAATRQIGTVLNTIPVLGAGGRYAPVRLGSGTPSQSNWLRGDGAWWPLPAGLTYSQIDTRIATWARTSSPSGVAPITRGGTGASLAAQARTNLGLKSAAIHAVGTGDGDVAALGPGGLFAAGRLGSGTALDHQTLTYRAGSGRWEYLAKAAGLKSVTRIPTSFDEQLLYLTHAERDVNTVAANATLTPGIIDRAGGEFFGWSRDGNGYLATGTLSPDNLPVEVIGGNVGQFSGTGENRSIINWSVEYIGSRNRDFKTHWPVIVIAGTAYSLSSPVWSASMGLWVFEVASGPPAFSGDKTINFLSAATNGSYLFGTGTIIKKAGLWTWDGVSYDRLTESDFEPQFRALAGQASGEGWGFESDWFRHKSSWLGSDRIHRLLGVTQSPEDTGKTWAVTRADGAIRLRSSPSAHKDLAGAAFDPDGLALAAFAEPISMFDPSVVEGWTDPNVGATPGLWAAHKRTSAYTGSGSVTLIDGDATDAVSLGLRHVQRLPPSIISGVADGYLCHLNLSTANGIYLYLGLSNSESGGDAGPSFTGAAKSSLGIAVRAANGTTKKWRLGALSTATPTDPYRWTGASIPAALVTALKAENAQVVLVDTANANVNWADLTFGGVSSATEGVGVNNVLILKDRRLRVWRGDDEVDITVGGTPGATYRLPTLLDSDRWLGLDADTETLYTLRVGADLHLARLPYSSIGYPAHHGTEQQLRAVITAGPAAGMLWDSDVSGAGSLAAGYDLELAAGLTIGSLEMLPKPQGANEVARMEITSGDTQELNLATNKGSFTGDNQLIAGLSVGAVQVNSFGTIGGSSHYVQLGLNRASGETETFGEWRTTAGEGLGKSWYVVNPDGTYLEFRNSDSYSSGSSWLNIQSGTQNIVSTYAPGVKWTLICADQGGLTPNTAITLKRTNASTEAVTAWITHEATHSFYFVSPTGVITELLLSDDSPTADHLYWLVPNGPVRPAADTVFKILIALKGGIVAAETEATIDVPSIIYYSLLPVPKGTGATAQPDGVPVAISVRDKRLSILYSQGGVARFSVGDTTVSRVVAEDIDIGQHIDPATPATIIMSDTGLLFQASDFVRKWTLVLGGGGGEGVESGASGAAGGTTGGDTVIDEGRVRQIFFARAATKPDEPPYSYLGSAGYSPPVTDTSVWQGSDPDELSLHPLWMATAESNERATGGWETSTWTVLAINAFAVRYAVHLTLNATQFEANWHGPPQVFGQDRWMQIRDDTGAWGAPLVVARGPILDPWSPIVDRQYLGAWWVDQVMTITGNGTLFAQKELLFTVQHFLEFEPPINYGGTVSEIWARRSADLDWPLAPYGSAAARDKYAFRVQSNIHDGMGISLGNDDLPEGDATNVQTTFWVRFVQDVVNGECCYGSIQVFGFQDTYNRGWLYISKR